MDNKINFTGGFLIRKPLDWEGIQKALPRKKCVFQHFNDAGDKFVAVKTHYDQDMINMLVNRKVDFKFYPEINLKTRLDNEKVEEAQQIIASQSKSIEGKCFRAVQRFNFPKYKWVPDDHIGQTLNALGLKEKNCKISYTTTGAVKIMDKSGKKVIALASPNSHKGYNYVLELPKEKNGDPRRLVVDMNGEIVDEIDFFNRDKFNEYFERNLRIEQGRIRPKK